MGQSRVSHGWRSIDRTQHWDRPQLPGADKRTATAEIHWYTLVTYISDFRKPLGFGRCIANSNLSSSATPLKQYSCASYVDILKGCLEGSSVNISWLKGMTTAEPPMIAGISTGDTGGTIEADLFFFVLRVKQRKQNVLVSLIVFVGSNSFRCYSYNQFFKTLIDTNQHPTLQYMFICVPCSSMFNYFVLILWLYFWDQNFKLLTIDLLWLNIENQIPHILMQQIWPRTINLMGLSKIMAL